MVDLIEMAKKKDFIQLVHFEHPWFKKDKLQHVGLFGTIVRLLPFFDDSNTNLVLSVEADAYQNILVGYSEMYKLFADRTEKVFFITRECYYIRPRYKNSTKFLKNNHVPLLGTFWVRGKLPEHLYNDFLNCIHKIKLTDECEYLGVFVKTRSELDNNTNDPEKYITSYGVDELFATKIVKYLIDNKIDYMIDLLPDLSNTFDQAYHNNEELINSNIHKNLIKRIMNDQYNNKMSVQDNYKNMRKYLCFSYTFKPKNKSEKKIIKNTVTELLKLLRNDEYKKYGFDIENLFCLKKSYDIFHAVVLNCQGYECKLIKKYDGRGKIFTYSPELETYIKKNIFPIILLNTKKYYIIGSFKRKIPYVTDVDVINNAFPDVNKNNITEKILNLIDKKNPNIILAYVSCGMDDRFTIKNNFDDEIERIKLLLNDSDIQKINDICKKYYNNEGARNYYIDGILNRYRKIRWIPTEIKENKKKMPGNIIISFIDTVAKYSRLTLFYYINVGPCMIGFDISVIYDNDSSSRAKSVEVYVNQLADASKYSSDYFEKLYSLRNYFGNVKNIKTFNELDRIIEHKLGLYKQLLNRITVYRRLYESNNITVKNGTEIVKYIIMCIPHLPFLDKMNNHIDNNITDSATEIIESDQNHQKIKTIVKQIENISNENNNKKIDMWNIQLKKLYEELEFLVSDLSKPYFFKYIEKIPKEDASKFYELKK